MKGGPFNGRMHFSARRKEKKNLGLLSAHGRPGSSMQRLKRLKKMKIGPCGTQSRTESSL